MNPPYHHGPNRTLGRDNHAGASKFTLRSDVPPIPFLTRSLHFPEQKASYNFSNINGWEAGNVAEREGGGRKMEPPRSDRPPFSYP